MDLTTIFCHVDDFCKEFSKELKERSLIDGNNISLELINSKLTLSEVMAIQIYFHFSNYRTFKHYYIKHIETFERSAFPNLVSYNRFVELMQLTLFPLTTFMTVARAGRITGISYIDSTKLQVCHNARIRGHKVFKGLAQRGKTTTGWFYGFKLHIIVNDYGEIISFLLTPGNVSDCKIDVVLKLAQRLYGKLFGDRGYISKSLFEELYDKGIKLVTRIKKNMKNKLMDTEDKVLLSMRGIIESVINLLKQKAQVEHTRHRSTENFLTNIAAAIVAYTFFEKKPSIRQNLEVMLPCF